MKLAIVSSHPIQYNAPWFKYMSSFIDLHVYYMHNVKIQGSDKDEFGVSFEWDVDLLEGYDYTFLNNISKNPNVSKFKGCDVPEIYSHLKQGQYDAVLVMGWYLKGFWQAILACKLYNILLLVRGDSYLQKKESFFKSGFKLVLYPIMLKVFDIILYVGQNNKKYLKTYKVPENKLVFCPHFVDQSYFSEKNISKINQISNELNLKEKSFKLLFVGKFIRIKRPMDILEALKILQNDKLNYELIFIGGGILEQELRNFCEINKELQVHFMGFRNQSELSAYYLLADALIVPSESETWGLVVNEAFSLHTPAIVSHNVGCEPDMISKGKTGEVFKCGDAKDLAYKIRKLARYSDSPKVKNEIIRKNVAYSMELATKNIILALKSCQNGRNEK